MHAASQIPELMTIFVTGSAFHKLFISRERMLIVIRYEPNIFGIETRIFDDTANTTK
jgi:hypothetical protein